MRVLAVVLTVVSLVLSGCSLPDPAEETEWNGDVGAETRQVQLGSAYVTFPEDVAAPGTNATVMVLPAAESAHPNTVALSSALEISLEDGAQPLVPVQITIPLDGSSVDPATIAGQYLLFGSATSVDGTEEFITGQYDQATNSFTMETDHFSTFRVFGIDFGAIMGEVRTAIMQGMGLEFPAPDCADNTIEIAGTQYEAFSYPEGYLCLNDDQGNLTVDVHPGLAMPYVITTTPNSDATSTPTEFALGTFGILLMTEGLRLTSRDSSAGLLPGAKATFTFDGAPREVSLNFDQNPGVLLMMILAEVADVLGVATLETLGNLQCLADLTATGLSLEEGISGEGVGLFVTAFANCAGTIADLNTLGRFILSVLVTAPAFLVTNATGIINELAGTDQRTVNILITPPTRPSDQALLNGTLPGDVCWSGSSGWLADVPVQLSGGRGAAYTADGTFADVGVISTEVLGWEDLDGDGADEVVLALECAGSPPENCCAGRGSLAPSVAVLTVNEENLLEKAAPTLMGGESGPGDEYGPAARQITEAQLQGDRVITTEALLYPETYTPDQVNGDPYELVSVDYRLVNGEWDASSE